MKTSIKPTVGNWATEEGFFNREFERKNLADKVRAGVNLSLVAPRRVGKTSLLRAVQRDLESEFACLFVDLAAATSAEAAVGDIAEVAWRHQSLKTNVTTWLGRFQASASVATPVGDVSLALRDALEIDWQRRGHQLIEGLVANNNGVVLFLDEVPILVRTLLRRPTAPGERSPADVFLSWLRKVTQQHRSALRVVMTGSIGLAPLVARANLSATLNAFDHLTLNPWSRETTVAALLALAADTATPLTGKGAQAMADLLGIGVPHHVQLFFQHVSEHQRQHRLNSIGPDEATRVWTDRLLVDQVDLPHWEQRLADSVDDGHAPIARRLLTAAALREPLTVAAARAVHGDDDALRSIFEVLEHDGYLARRDDGWYFPNRLLRAWWARKHGPWMAS